MSFDIIYKKLLSIDIFEYNDYFKQYCKLISNNIDTKATKNKTEKHHIIPRYYFIDNKIKIDNSNSNLVNLSYKDHLLAHYYLTLCSVGKYKNSNFTAVFNMLGRNAFTLSTSELYILLPEYEKLKEEYSIEISDVRKGTKRTYESILKGIETRKGYKHSSITIEKIRNSNIGKSRTDEVRLKMSISHKNKHRHWYTDGKRNILVEESIEIPDNFLPGRTVSSETKEKLAKSQQERFKHSNGTMLGKHLTSEQKQKCSKSHKGVSMSEDTKHKLSNTLKGSKIYNNGEVSIRVLLGELPPEGFVEGRLTQKSRGLEDD